MTAVTSLIAHRTGLPRRPTQRMRVLQFIKDQHPCGATLDQTQEHMGIVSSIGARFAELRRLGAIEDSGITRMTRSGSPAIVWVLTPAVIASLTARGLL